MVLFCLFLGKQYGILDQMLEQLKYKLLDAQKIKINVGTKLGLPLL
jgi:hypothetical protein